MQSDPGVAAALGRIPSGVFILTAAHGGRRAAMMASWVQQASFAPPALSVAVGRDRSIRTLIDGARGFVVCVVGHGDTTLMRKFARSAPTGEDPLAGVAVANAPGGLPYLTEALAYLECRVLRVVDFSADHDIYVAQVMAGAVLKEGPSLTHLRGNGLRY